VEIRAVDGSGGEFQRAFGVLADVAAEREFPTLLPVDEALTLLTTPPADYRFTCLSTGDFTGAAWVTWPLAENEQLVVVDLAVLPTHRRRGIASALLGAVKAQALADGRSVLIGETYTPYGEAVGDGAAFAQASGFESQYAALHQVRDFPGDDVELPQHPGYELLSWADGCPEHLLDQYCELRGLVDEEVPLDDLEIQPKRWTRERLRATEEHRRAQGHLASTTVAIAPDGVLAGYTELTGKPQQPERLDQHDTLVRPEHRGHRLGLALKIANLRELRTRFPGPATIHTWNAEANGPMIAVNDLLAFRAVEHQHVWHSTL
jgi:GNAT superfamily N-acetyltransferase